MKTTALSSKLREITPKQHKKSKLWGKYSARFSTRWIGLGPIWRIFSTRMLTSLLKSFAPQLSRSVPTYRYTKLLSLIRFWITLADFTSTLSRHWRAWDWRTKRFSRWLKYLNLITRLLTSISLRKYRRLRRLFPISKRRSLMGLRNWSIKKNKWRRCQQSSKASSGK